MREALFIKKNLEKWQTYQATIPQDADESSDRFITLVDDLSYAKTFYPRSTATRWLNALTARSYLQVYQNRREPLSRIWHFWKYEIPLLFRKYHKILLFTFLLFSAIVAISVFSSINEPTFIKGILGNEYVRMTERNIENGDPFGVYKDNNKWLMFVRIAANNVWVAALTFISGVTLGLGTLRLLWSNGMMLGAFQYMFFAKNLGWQSVLVIWIHGTIEISSLIISAVAGFIIAKSILMPGTYTRKQSFIRGTKEAAMVFICVVPFIILAAFFESYITYLMSASFETGKTGMPIWLSVLILAASALLMTFYFVIWPIMLEKRGFTIKKDTIANRVIHG